MVEVPGPVLALLIIGGAVLAVLVVWLLIYLVMPYPMIPTQPAEKREMVSGPELDDEDDKR